MIFGRVDRAAVVRLGFFRSFILWPRSGRTGRFWWFFRRAAELSSYGGRVGDVAHGLVEGQAQDLDEEVDGVAGQVALWPAPVILLEDEAWESGQGEVARFLGDELESPFFQQRREFSVPRRLDLFAGPARAGRGFKRGAGHSLSFSEVG